MKKFTLHISSNDPNIAILLRKSIAKILNEDELDAASTTTILLVEDYSTGPSRYIAKHTYKENK